MEKLIELLNEYETPRSWVVYKNYDDYDGTFYWVDIDGETEIAWSDSLICSKKFWFIEWLVDNDKIELCPISKDYRIQIDLFGDGATYWELWWEYRILMLLSIQENPISFLISILK